MKKTIIALLALAGVAAAENTVEWTQLTLDNSDIVTMSGSAAIGNANKITIGDDGYGSLSSKSAALGWSEDVTLNQSWKLTFSLTDKALANDTTIFSTSASVNGQTNYQSSGELLKVMANGSLDMGEEQSAAGLITANTPVTLTLVFLAKQDLDKTDIGGTFLVYVGDDGEKGDAVISYDVDDRVTFVENSSSRLWTNTSAEEFTKIALYSGGVVTVPEPTTATLSLLALAGLAARRRRK